MPIFAISLMAILSLVGATIALGMDSRAGNHLQHAADASALGGATAFLNSKSPKAEDRLKAAETQAKILAGQNSKYAISDFEIDAVTEDAYGQYTKLAVELEFKPVNYFAKFAGDRSTTPVRRRAVASATWGFPLCVLALARSGPGITISGNGVLSAEDCIVWSNSDDRASMLFQGGDASSKAFCAAGQSRTLSRARVSPQPETGCQTLPDPLAGFDVPMDGLCDHVNLIANRKTSSTLSPGIYCGGIDLKARNVTFEPGIYLIRGGEFRINATQTVVAEGVTFLFDGALNRVDINGNSGLTIRAPTEGPTAGIAFAQLPSLFALTNGVLAPQFTVKGELKAEGVFYIPAFDMTVLAQGAGDTTSPYLQLVVNRLKVQSQGALRVKFNEADTNLPIVIKPARQARLVE